jgi:putative two-component system response regulator
MPAAARRTGRALRRVMFDNSEPERKLILYVGGEQSSLRLLRPPIERAGYRLLSTPSGRDGLRLARDSRPDLILLDYMTADLGGKEVFERLAAEEDARLRRTPVVMLARRACTEGERRALLRQGVSAYLRDPFGAGELADVIESVLMMHSARERERTSALETRGALLATARALVTLTFSRDRYTGLHSRNVSILAEGMALRCGLSEEQAFDVRLGALLHDVGKVAVPEMVLAKRGPLTAEEMSMMRRHPVYGARALSAVPHLDAARAIVLHHHERWDGLGYPVGLSGQSIPFGARLVAVADAYDAMTSNRPYRNALPSEVAVARLLEGSGTQFDPSMVPKLLEHLEERGAPPAVEHAEQSWLGLLEELSPAA